MYGIVSRAGSSVSPRTSTNDSRVSGWQVDSTALPAALAEAYFLTES